MWITPIESLPFIEVAGLCTFIVTILKTEFFLRDTVDTLLSREKKNIPTPATEYQEEYFSDHEAPITEFKELERKSRSVAT